MSYFKLGTLCGTPKCTNTVYASGLCKKCYENKNNRKHPKRFMTLITPSTKEEIDKINEWTKMKKIKIAFKILRNITKEESERIINNPNR